MAKKKETKETAVDVLWNKDRRVKKITLPEGMKIPVAIDWLERKMTELEKRVELSEVFNYYPTDGAVAFWRALEAIYGFADPQAQRTWFGENPPKFITVKTSTTESVRVPVGEIKVPDLDGSFYSSWKIQRGKPAFSLTYVGKKKNQAEVERVIAETRDILENASIYKGKAIRVNFPDLNHVESIDEFEPEFMNTADTDPDSLVFPQDVDKKIRTSLFTPVTHTARVRKAGVPLKRGVLLAGPYGTGKTLTASVLAHMCENHGWSFLYLKNVADLSTAIEFAKMYGPAVIFSEDIDEVLGTQKRTNEVNSILNTIDGVDGKQNEVMVVLTTNHVDRVNRAMLRPGRLDDVITVRPPDAEAAIRLVKQYGGDLVKDGEDFTESGKRMDGMIPAVIREVVERAKLASLAENEEIVIDDASLAVAASTMKDQLELLREEEPDTRSDIEKAADRLNTGLSFLSGLRGFTPEGEVIYDSTEQAAGE
jgi:transitional endoplasmic reticulum ATPase